MNKAPHLDGRHTVFGRVEAGMSVLRRMEQLGSAGGNPSQDVVIADCGEIGEEDWGVWQKMVQAESAAASVAALD